MIKICAHCGKEFETNDRRTVTCSKQCQKARQKQQVRDYYWANHERVLAQGRERSRNWRRGITAKTTKNTTVTPKLTKKQRAAEDYNKQRLQHQREAYKLGVSYGQYVAWLQAGLIKEANYGCDN